MYRLPSSPCYKTVPMVFTKMFFFKKNTISSMHRIYSYVDNTFSVLVEIPMLCYKFNEVYVDRKARCSIGLSLPQMMEMCNRCKLYNTCLKTETASEYLVCILLRVSIAVTKHHKQKHHGKERVDFICSSI